MENLNVTQNRGGFTKNQLNEVAFYSSKMAYRPVWKDLGISVEDAIKSEQAIKIAGLDYEVSKKPIFTKKPVIGVGDNGDITTFEMEEVVPNVMATYREDNNAILGIVGKDYEVIQNKDVFNFFDALLEDGKGDIFYETAGALGSGERIFLTAKTPTGMKIGKNDYIDNYIFMHSSHDGSGSITVAFTPVRIACSNTLNAALKGVKATNNYLKIRHTENASKRMKDALLIMKMCENVSQKMELIFNDWTKIKMNDEELKKYLKIVLCPSENVAKELRKNDNLKDNDEISTNFSNIIDKVLEYNFSNDSQLLDTTKGTLFGAYNAITGYYQNVFKFTDQEKKAKSILFGGTGQQRGQKAFDLASEFAKNGNSVLVY